MKLTRGLVGLSLIFSLSLITLFSVPLRPVLAQETSVALQRGYRTGYSDGYMAGYRDSIDNVAKNLARHPDYAKADRAYNKDYGTVEDYRDGYQQGFEAGYGAGFEKRAFEASIPSSLGPRSTTVPESSSSAASAVNENRGETINQKADSAVSPAENDTQTDNQTAAAPIPAGVSDSADASKSNDDAAIRKISYSPTGDAVIVIPRDTEIIVEMQDELSAATAVQGDKFTARVVSPAEIAGAVIEGRVERVQKAGRIKRRSEILLSFDRIVVSETRWSNFDAILGEVLPVKGDNIRRVDGEGTAVGKSSIKPDAIKIGASTGAGASIGALSGGPIGAAVGASLGAAFGIGSVIVQRGSDVKLNRSQQLRIRSSYETQIR